MHIYSVFTVQVFKCGPAKVILLLWVYMHCIVKAILDFGCSNLRLKVMCNLLYILKQFNFHIVMFIDSLQVLYIHSSIKSSSFKLIRAKLNVNVFYLNYFTMVCIC